DLPAVLRRSLVGHGIELEVLAQLLLRDRHRVRVLAPRRVGRQRAGGAGSERRNRGPQALALGLGLPAQEEIPQRREIALEADPAAPLLVARALEERLHGADELRRPAGVVAPDDIRVPDLLLAARRPRRQLRDEL